MKKTIFKQSPNVSPKPIVPKGIILHHTAGSYIGSVSWCLNPQSQVSYHAIVNLNGDMTVLAKDQQRAWHAGVSIFKGRKNCNDFMLGIAVSGDTNKREITEDELNTIACWCVDKMHAYNFGIDMITTHKEVAEGRKNDVDFRAYNKIIEKIKKYF